MAERPEGIDDLDTFLNGQKWASLQSLAGMLDVKESTMRSWMLRGTAPTWYKLGHLTRFRPDDVRAWLAENRNRVTVPPAHDWAQLSILELDELERARADERIDAEVV
jgi:hypothetical protein